MSIRTRLVKVINWLRGRGQDGVAIGLGAYGGKGGQGKNGRGGDGGNAVVTGGKGIAICGRGGDAS